MHQYDIVLDVNVINRTNETMQVCGVVCGLHRTTGRVVQGSDPSCLPCMRAHTLCCTLLLAHLPHLPPAPTPPTPRHPHPQNVSLELATMGDLKLVERPQAYTLAPGAQQVSGSGGRSRGRWRSPRVVGSPQPLLLPTAAYPAAASSPAPTACPLQKSPTLHIHTPSLPSPSSPLQSIRANIKVSSTETGAIFGNLVYESTGYADRRSAPMGGGGRGAARLAERCGSSAFTCSTCKLLMEGLPATCLCSRPSTDCTTVHLFTLPLPFTLPHPFPLAAWWC